MQAALTSLRQRSVSSTVNRRVQIKTRAQNLVGRQNQRIDIQPGMTATVEIKTGSNTVLRYLTKPITKTISESLIER